jgi:hypothetical protein
LPTRLSRIAASSFPFSRSSFVGLGSVFRARRMPFSMRRWISFAGRSSSLISADHMPKGSPFKFGRRKCIFCKRQPPEAIISKEHVFADWLRELFPRGTDTTHTLGVMEWATNRGTKVLDKTGQGHSGSKKIRHVCQLCNGTWLSNDVEDVAKPVLTPLLIGHSLVINAAMQKIIATWAANPSSRIGAILKRWWIINQLLRPKGLHYGGLFG